MANNVFYTWITKKIQNQYNAIVIKVESFDTIQKESGNYTRTTIECKKTFKTRARAKSYAQKWVRYYKSILN